MSINNLVEVARLIGWWLLLRMVAARRRCRPISHKKAHKAQNRFICFVLYVPFCG
jgi:hypothetical protein